MATTEHATSADGTRIAFERHGRGGPVVVLVEPPLHHRAFSAFSGLVPLLAARLTVVVYDRRGRGTSGDTPPYHPDREVDDLAAVIAELGGVGLYGYSGGALLALRAASQLSSVSALVLLEPPLHEDGAPRPDPLTLELADLIAADRRADAVLRFHEAIGVPAEILAEMAGSPAFDEMVAVAPTLVHDCTISDATDAELLAGVRQPTLVLDSASSTDDLTGWAAAAAAQLPNARHRSLEGQWHTVADELLAPVIVDHVVDHLECPPWDSNPEPAD